MKNTQTYPRDMTPVEIFEYKLKNANFPVTVFEDADIAGKGWCERNLSKEQWLVSKYTNVFEHTFSFTRKEDADRFDAFINADRRNT